MAATLGPWSRRKYLLNKMSLGQLIVAYFTHLGPVGLVLQEANERKRREVIATARAAFDSYVKAGQVRFTAACWLVAARAKEL